MRATAAFRIKGTPTAKGRTRGQAEHAAKMGVRATLKKCTLVGMVGINTAMNFGRSLANLRTEDVAECGYEYYKVTCKRSLPVAIAIYLGRNRCDKGG